MIARSCQAGMRLAQPRKYFSPVRFAVIPM